MKREKCGAWKIVKSESGCIFAARNSISINELIVLANASAKKGEDFM